MGDLYKLPVSVNEFQEQNLYLECCMALSIGLGWQRMTFDLQVSDIDTQHARLRQSCYISLSIQQM